MSKQTVYCDQCGVEMERWPSLINEKNFCSRECHHEWQRGRTKEANAGEKIFLECDYCGNELIRSPSKVKNRDHFFCDLECKGNYQRENPTISHERERIEVECANCDATLKRIQSHVDQFDRHFCDQQCKAEWQSEHKGGEGHPWWEGGEYTPYYGEDWTVHRRKARKRDAYQCQFCGIKDSMCKAIYDRELDVHHVVPRREFDDLAEANRLGNLLTLCVTCHTRFHKSRDL